MTNPLVTPEKCLKKGRELFQQWSQKNRGSQKAMVKVVSGKPVA